MIRRQNYLPKILQIIQEKKKALIQQQQSLQIPEQNLNQYSKMSYMNIKNEFNTLKYFT
ncbi:unnamed protein product [Paramecium sonneborni]|uniref:Uncharacterized protein n=1 Tax=Paramecium sonneborni TaxID=65129 RepID=A0A8S1LNS7_9CILI|nr:unnamed protein product [Paramecium sonneborni]